MMNIQSSEISLWIQRESMSEGNFLSYNGQLVTKDDERYYQIYHKYFNTNEYKVIIAKKQLSVYSKPAKHGRAYLICSNFNEKDIDGRHYGFQFYIGGVRNLETAYQQLQKTIQANGFSLLADCEQTILDYIRRKKLLLLCGILCVITGVCITTIAIS